DYEKATGYFQRAVELTPNNPTRLAALGWSLFNLQRYREARTAFEKASQIDPALALAKEGLAATEGKQ
ncbi:MAG: tetratricopeptide repeat protein, partial [Dehalococcoidia bacterium]|nr:tetratricopeptide repeat protein [Dehalococcoidia bacterium]